MRYLILERFVMVLREPGSAYRTWKSLVLTHRVSGRQVHDARLAALMSAYRIRRIVTLNPSDFARFPAIEPLTPTDVMAL